MRWPPAPLPHAGGSPAGVNENHARLQARLQVASEDEGRVRYEILDPERDVTGELLINRGLLAMPVPVTGDLFFDIEGARYYSEDGKCLSSPSAGPGA